MVESDKAIEYLVGPIWKTLAAAVHKLKVLSISNFEQFTFLPLQQQSSQD